MYTNHTDMRIKPKRKYLVNLNDIIRIVILIHA